MKAAFITEQGSPDVIQFGDLPRPELEPTQVLVRMGASGINPIDTYIRSGAVPLPVEFPFVPGFDVAGTVEAVGESVTRFRPGDRVWGSNQSIFGRQGTLAEFVPADEQWLYPTPETMSDEQAAAGALTGITAQLGLFRFGNLQPGEIVFVNGGSGGVGSMVVQFAKAAQAQVITTAGSHEKRDLCRRLGADLVLDYHSSTLDDDIQAFTKEHGGIDVWWETQREPTLPRTIPMMKQRGRIILMAGREAEPQFPLGGFYTNDLQLLGFAMFNASPDEQRTCAERMNDGFQQNLWEPIIGERFPLSKSAVAHQVQEENTLNNKGTLTGKIIVLPD